MAKPEIFTVTISPDKQKAFITVRAGSLPVKLTTNRLKTVLNDKGVVLGIKQPVLEKIVQVYKDHDVLENILVAEGKLPVTGENPTIQYTYTKVTPQDGSLRGRMDYRETSSLINVARNQILAVEKWEKAPQMGATVTGEKILPPHSVKSSIRPGENITRELKGGAIYYRAAIDGALDHTGDNLRVFNSLKVDKDVDFNVGNIRFNGDVDIGRDVMADFIVEAKGKLYVWGTAVACQLTAEKDLTVRNGIIGKGRGKIKARGNIFAGYVEKAEIHANKNVTIKSRITGSTVTCDGTIKVENEGSRVVSSVLKAAGGIELWNMGSRTDRHSKLITGLNPKYEKEFEAIRHIVEKKTAAVKLIERRYGIEALSTKRFNINLTPKMRIETQMWELLRDEITEAKKMLKAYEHMIYNNDAGIIIKGTLFPGVYIKIGKEHIISDKEYQNVEVRYSPADGKLKIM